MQNTLINKYPTAWHGDMWREGAPFGDGLIGGLVYGGAAFEKILINHALLWRGGKNEALPDISDRLPEIRALLDAHEVEQADRAVSDALREKGYGGNFVTPSPVCDVVVQTPPKGIFSHYRREVQMDKAQVQVSWQEGDAVYTRRTFASRANHLVFTKFTVQNGVIDTRIGLTLHDPETLGNVVIPRQEQLCRDNFCYFAAENVSIISAGDFGAVCKIVTDGSTKCDGGFLCVSGATEILMAVSVFVATDRAEGFAQAQAALCGNFDYDAELAKHVALHGPLYSAVDFSISNTCTANEELLLQAFEETAANELLEKLYAFGRYLFICSTAEKDTLPCHLIGLFNGTYQCFWAFNMYNVNFEMIYWQALTGNLPRFLRLALDYTERFVPDFQENAQKIFGCRGILINSVNAPDSGIYKCLANHIVNWTGAAAWFAAHFFDYYRFTLDETYLRDHALPFMYQAALFYEDFAVENRDGYYDLYPSVSPENTAANVRRQYGREVETCKNATMDFALLKELLTNLLKGCEITGQYPEKQQKWKEMLSKIPPYQVNADGAVREWMDRYYEDNYCHRHHSHLYPVFPGCEITKDHALYPAFEKAEDTRLKFGISDQSSWSVVFMACIAARMERGDFALTLLDTIARTCLMNNLFTVHNDWRRMGPITCADFRVAPFQIDANIGFPAAIDEMLLQSQQENLFVLPALPEKWPAGHINGLLARGNITCNICWQNDRGSAVFTAKTAQTKTVVLGSGFCFADGTDKKELALQAGIAGTVEFRKK